MRFCPQCGSEHRLGALFCGSCGHPLRAEPASAGEQFVPPPPAAVLAPPRPRRTWTHFVLPVLAALVAGSVVGYAAHFLPQSNDLRAHGVGKRSTALSTSQVAAASAPSASDVDDRGGLTSFVSSCGKVLDVVPTRAVSSGTALTMTLEFRPVCPTGEWISSRQFRLDVLDTAGAPLAVGSLDFSARKLYVPGFADPTTTLTASVGPGTAWAAPDTLSGAITDGLVRVACRDASGAKGTPATASPAAAASTVRATATPVTDRAETQKTALEALERQAADDDASVSELEGSWVPQLSSKTDGTYDPLDDKTYTYADIYSQYLSLRLKYPNVRVLSSSAWRSYKLPGHWVVIAGTPFTTPEEPNTWCDDRGIPQTQCFAKQLVRDGAPEGTIRHRP
jgi:hypothetical protein